MVVILVDHVGAVDLGVDVGDFLQRLYAGADEEAHEAELDAVLLLEQFLVLIAHGHHRAHVDLVEGRQHRGGVLRLLQAARDGLAQPRHLHALFARGVVGRRRRADLTAAAVCATGWARRGALDRRHHVALGDAAVLAGALDVGRVDAGFGGNLAHRRRQRHIAGSGRGRRGLASAGFGAARGGAAGGGQASQGRRPAPSLIWPSSAPTATVSPSFAAMSDRRRRPARALRS